MVGGEGDMVLQIELCQQGVEGVLYYWRLEVSKYDHVVTLVDRHDALKAISVP